MAPAPQIHVVSKSDNTRHIVCRLPADDHVQETRTLAPSSVRALVSVISLSSNNLSYARAGTLLHWWDTYPVPGDAPPPYDDRGEWGIVPAWGYARVVESTIEALPGDSLLWGLWPTSSRPVELRLDPVESSSGRLWAETSPHRSRLMTMYNHYQHHPGRLTERFMAYRSLFPVFESAHLLNRAVFPASPAASPTHPLGLPASALPWSSDTARLASAVVVSMSASSKTGRSLAWELARNRGPSASTGQASQAGGPLALLQLTSSPRALDASSAGAGAGAGAGPSALAVRSVAYDEPSAVSMAWIRQFHPARVVIFDFGAPARTLDAFVEALSESEIVSASSVTIIQVGQEPKVYTDAEQESFRAQSARLGKVQFNTSGVRDRAIEASGPSKYVLDLDEAWARFYAENGLSNIEIKYHVGVEGPLGIEGAWQRLCDGKVSPTEGVVVKMG